MRLSHTKHPRGRFFRLARLALVLSAFTLAVIAGCGGSQSTTDNTTNNPPTSTTPPAPTPDTTPSGPAASNESPEVLGARVFAARCALCHGPDGHGDGPGAAALNPKPRNYHDKAYMDSRTDAQLLEVIRNGKGAMPKWSGILSEAEIQAVLKHVRSLSQKP